ncbi:uncharacterized protein C12orf50 homolog [Strigops habroptila]|uniref:uncharacterized protein C12orf50 homolog n=1 Tax=Strigops habroptila TaxID=2489341 RepID=UPI0011CF5D8C|nr:uncharacterized protein C12orf50 homolog [Strigops habroptila]
MASFLSKYLELGETNLQQKLKNIACFWETQPSGCVRISCAFRHSKPRHINGLFLPPTNSAPLPQGDQEILPPVQCEGSLTSPENIVIPIHPPLIINLNDEEDDEEIDEEDDEEKYVSDWVPKTAEDIEEERAIKEICYKSGEFYGIQQPDQHQSSNPVSPSQETELLPLEATQWDLQKGDSNTIPPELNNTNREGESLGRRVPKESVPRMRFRSFENGESHTAEPKVQPGYQKNGHCKDGETPSSLPLERETGRKSYFCSSEPRRSAYVVYRTVTVTQEPKFSGPRAAPERSVWKSSKGKNQPGKNRRFWTQTDIYDKYPPGSYNAPTWRKRNPQAKTFSKTKTTIQSQEDMEVNRKGKRYEDRREMKQVLEFTRKI